MSLRVAVLGCGVAGSVLGHLLSRGGIDVVCFEKAGAAEHAESGTGLNVGPNALAMLGQADARLAAQVRSASHAWRRWQVSQVDGQQIFDIALADFAANDGIRIRWSELYRVLRAPLKGSARFGATVTHCGFDPCRPDTLVVDFSQADGRLQQESGFDLAVAADGRYSAVRRQLLGQWETQHIPVALFRLLVPDDSRGLIDDYAWWFNGPNRLLAFAVPAGQVYMAGSFPLPVAGAEIPASARTPEALARYFAPAQGTPCDAVKWMVDQLVTCHEQIHWARLQESPAQFRDASGQVLFLGDAAHGMVPTLGQGATQAVEDACVAAAVILKRHASRPAGMPPAAHVADITREIEAERSDRVRWVADFSRDATAAMLAGSDPAAQMRRLLAPPYPAAWRRLWRGVPLEWNLHATGQQPHTA